MNKPTMWVLVGLSGSGKSTIATQIANENPKYSNRIIRRNS